VEWPGVCSRSAAGAQGDSGAKVHREYPPATPPSAVPVALTLPSA